MTLLLVAMPCATAQAHRLVTLPLEDVPGDEQVLPVPTVAPHLRVLSSGTVAFGQVLSGSTVAKSFEVRNDSGESLSVVLGVAAPFSVDPLDVAFSLAPGATRVIAVSVTGVAAGDFTAAVLASSTHAGAPALDEDLASLSVSVRLPPPGITLSLPDFGLSDVSSFDFGLIPGEQHTYTAPNAPTLRVRISHTGTPGVHTAVTGLTIGAGLGITVNPVGVCYFASGTVDMCVGDVNGDADGDGGLFVDETLAPGASIDFYVRLFPFKEGWVEQSFTVSSANVADKTLALTGGVVPIGMSQGPFYGAEGTAPLAKAGGTGYEGYGRSTDPLGPDTIGGFVPAGYDPRGLFALGDVDDVDARTGNPVIPISLGGRQVVRGDLGWEVMLVINGRVWRRETNWGFPDEYTLPPPGERGGASLFERLHALPAFYPNPAYNATVGVSLHLGRLLPPLHGTADDIYGLDPANPDIVNYEKKVNTGPRWVYIDPSGTEHPFYKAMHGDEPLGSYFTEATQYTRDGSYLRFTRETLQDSQGVSVDAIWIERPNGQRHLFLHHEGAEIQSTLPDEWLLHRIEDRSGNAVVIEYDDAARTWTIEGATVSRSEADELGSVTKLGWRKTEIKFNAAGLPTSVAHGGFGEATPLSSGAKRQFNLTYSSTVQVVERPQRSRWHEILRNNHGVDTKLHFRTLTGITQPEGGAWGIRWELDDSDGDGTSDDIWLAGVDLPTGGAIDYTWGAVWDVAKDCGNGGANQPLWGVRRRTVTDVGGEELADQIYLRQHRSASDVDSGVCSRWANDQSNHVPRPELRVAVWTDLRRGAATGKSSLEINYYSVYPFQPDTSRGWTHVERNLNLTRVVADPVTSGGTRYLSRELYGCDVDLPRWDTADTPTIGYDANGTLKANVGDRIGDLVGLAACKKLETTYSRFEVERKGQCPSHQPDCLHGSRLVSQRVVQHAAGGDKWVRTERSNHDGVGNYRSSKLYSNYQGSSELQKRYRDHNSGEGTLTLNADYTVSGTYTPPAVWVLNDSGKWWVEEGGTKRGGERVFDGAGRLRLDRTWRLGGADPKDLVVKYAYSANGELDLERHFGADTYGCSNGNLPTTSEWTNYNANYWASSCQDYAIDYSYQYGVVSEKRVAGESVHEINRTIDKATGWTGTETANSGEVTTLDYDKMGRPTSVTRSHTANVALVYDAPNTTRGWRATVKGYGQQGSAADPTNRFVSTYDGLGRLVSEEIPTDDGTTVTRTRDYTIGGPLASFTSLADPAKGTTFEYDSRGRLTSRTNFDGSKSTVSYTGNHRVSVTGSVSTWDSLTQSRKDQNAVTVIDYDALGRVVQAQAPEGAITTWTYDPLGQIQTATRGTQAKTYGVDGRGFTTFEALPEKLRRVGGGTEQIATQLTNFDTRGNPRTLYERVRNATGTFGTVYRTTTRTYDALGRLTGESATGGASKSFVYDTSSGCPTNAGSVGQLTSATRVNLLGANGIWRVYSDFCYDAAGRLERRDTRVTSQSGGNPESGPKFRQTWGYDDFGNVTAETYPVVVKLDTTDPCPACGKTPGRTVTRTYDQGVYLTGVSDAATPALGATFSYHDDGLVQTVDYHGTSGSDQYFRDLTGMLRWRRMQLAGGLLDLGSITYDGSGNIETLGGDDYYYDRNGRLTRADLSDPVECEGCLYSYTYDDYDNISNRGTTDLLNNRLTGGTAAYDAFGNLTAGGSGGGTLSYDGFDKLTIETGTGATSIAVYDHDDLRVLFRSLTDPLNKPSYTFRDAQGRVIREIEGLGSEMVWKKDTVYGAGRSVASIDDEGVVRHYHTDQLGTVRYVTENGKTGGEELKHEPFGAPLIGAPSGERAVGFAGHEQQDSADITYMRGRSYLHAIGKFMQVDPGRDGWNGYTYSGNNPTNRIDPTGRFNVGSFIKASAGWFRGEGGSGSSSTRLLSLGESAAGRFNAIRDQKVRDAAAEGGTDAGIEAMREFNAGLEGPATVVAGAAAVAPFSLPIASSIMISGMTANISQRATGETDRGAMGGTLATMLAASFNPIEGARSAGLAGFLGLVTPGLENTIDQMLSSEDQTDATPSIEDGPIEFEPLDLSITGTDAELRVQDDE